jgi:hypothetical protein
MLLWHVASNDPRVLARCKMPETLRINAMLVASVPMYVMLGRAHDVRIDCRYSFKKMPTRSTVSGAAFTKPTET